MEEVTRKIPERVVDEMYVAMLEAKERLPNATVNLQRCLNYLEEFCGYQPPRGYKKP